LSNVVRTYQQFVDSNIALKKREDELQQTIDELEAKKAELQKPRFNEPLSEFHENNDNKDVNLEVQQEDIISLNDVLIPQTLQVHDIQDSPASVRGGNHEILDTADLEF